MEPGVIGLILSTLAGLSTLLGGAVVFFLHDYSVQPFAICMASSAGVMIYVSFVEMLPESMRQFNDGLIVREYTEKDAGVLAYCFATSCMLVSYMVTTIFDKLVHCMLHRYAGLHTVELNSLPREDEVKKNDPENQENQTEALSNDHELKEEVIPIFQKTVEEHSIIHCAQQEPASTNRDEMKQPCKSFSWPSGVFWMAPENLNIKQPTLNSDLCGMSKTLTSLPCHVCGATMSAPRLLSNDGRLLNVCHPNKDCVQRKAQSTTKDPQYMEKQKLFQESSSAPYSISTTDSLENNRLSKPTKTKQFVKILLMRSETSESERLEIAMAEEKFKKQQANFSRLGLVTALALAIHNFPEGLATFTASLSSPALGVGIAFAVAIHNIPEGFAVAVPIYFGTRSKWKGFWYSALSGIAEPVGALIAFFAIRQNQDKILFGILFSSISGIMLNISFRALYPTAIKYDPTNRVVSLSFFVAVIVIACSLIGLKFAG